MYNSLLELEVAKLIRKHGPASGMQVSSGMTCKCGYWNGIEEAGVNRPAGFQGLEWHLTQLVTQFILKKYPIIIDKD